MCAALATAAPRRAPGSAAAAPPARPGCDNSPGPGPTPSAFAGADADPGADTEAEAEEEAETETKKAPGQLDDQEMESSLWDRPSADPLSASASPVRRRSTPGRWRRLAACLWLGKVEHTGITPLDDDERIGTRWWAASFIFFSVDFNLLGFSSGTLAAGYGLGMYASLFTILGFSLLCCLPAAFLSTCGPRLGLRQMVQSRYSWGYFPVALVGICAAASSMGYSILDAVLGGDTLSYVPSHRSLTPVVGIVIISLISLIISFAGLRMISLVERVIWVPVLVSFITLICRAGTGPDGLHFPATPDRSTPKGVMSMGSVIARFYMSYAPGASDLTHYLRPDTSTAKLFWANYLGLCLGGIPVLMLGAAFSVSAQDIPAWKSALDVSCGNLFNVVMGNNPEGSTATRGWSKCCIVFLALSVCSNLVVSSYSFGLNLQTIFPILSHIPRFLWMVFATAIVLPLGIVVSLNSAFYSTLSNFTSVLGYWSALYIAPVILEWVIIRRRSAARFDKTAWNDWRRLPLGLAALASAGIALALLIPSIDQVWFVGPIAKHHTGDIAFEMGFSLAAVVYIPLRLLELHFWGA